MGKVLIIADLQELIESVATLLRPIGHTLFFASDVSTGWSQAIEKRVDVVLLSVQLAAGDGLALLPRLKQLPAGPEVVVIDRAGDPRAAEFALRNEVWDYLAEQSDAHPIALSLDQALQYREEQVGIAAPVPIKRERIIGNSPKMKACFDLLGRAAASDANVLIMGETGTGKELFARAIHSNSPRARSRSLDPAVRASNPRADKNFVVVDCTALPETLLESVLFGHTRGFFSGADRDHDSLIGQAHNGTLFLDEVGELPLSTQKTFLRVLQERRYRPLGGKNELESNFRLIAATNRNLEQMVEEGSLRKDLLFRLRSMTIELPALRERAQDIPDLVRFHTNRLCESYGMAPKGFSVEFLDQITVYSWPGNVRELVHTIDAVLAVAGNDPTLHAKHLPVHLRVQVVCKQLREPKVMVVPKHSGNGLADFKTYREQTERKYLTDLLRATQRNIPKACAISGISRSRLYEMLSKYDLTGQN
ncbi:MAG: sigma-54-dependent Fis family transcriptional regulator [Desulfobacteraceae bacterium]|nr:MAG: sigma-54-dependent Fis family transcriptional regulator [Desulfobacteraceae bacterium]